MVVGSRMVVHLAHNKSLNWNRTLSVFFFNCDRHRFSAIADLVAWVDKKKSGSSVCVMQWMGVIRNETLIETDITAIFVNCLRSDRKSVV